MRNELTISEAKAVYESGGNVIEYLKSKNGGQVDAESIMISYDLQAGSYTKLAEKNSAYISDYTSSLCSVIKGLGNFETIMEVGVGEATVMNPLMLKVDPENEMKKYGFDISWSRVRYALQNCEQIGIEVNLFVGDLFKIPLPSNSIDIVYSSHSLEPNGGKEKQALAELYRVAKEYIVLLEPDFQRADKDGKERMLKHGYVRNLPRHAKELGYSVIRDEPCDVFVNPLNPTGLTVIKKDRSDTFNEPNYTCPTCHSPLKKTGDLYYSESTGLIYPVINQIPCLLADSATLGTHFSHFNK